MAPENPAPAEEPRSEANARDARSYIAKSLIRLDELEARLRYPNKYADDPLEMVVQLKDWQLNALAAASNALHIAPK